MRALKRRLLLPMVALGALSVGSLASAFSIVANGSHRNNAGAWFGFIIVNSGGANPCHVRIFFPALPSGERIDHCKN